MSGTIVVSSFTKGVGDTTAPYTTLQTFFTNSPGSKTLPNGTSINIGGVPAWFMTYNLASDVIVLTGSGAPVTFTRSGGTYTASGSSFTISESIPTAPTALTLDSKNVNSVTISFTQSTAGIGPRTITNYQYSINNGTSFQPFSPPDLLSPVTISGLTAGVAYPIKLKATNLIGNSVESSALTVTPSSVPNAPTGVTPNPTGVNSEFTILWTAPESNGGAIITKYRIKGYLASNNSYLGFTETASATPTSITITSLTSDPGPGTYTFINGTNYYFRVEAFNENGYSAQSTSSGSNSPYGPPGTVSNINLTRGNQEVALTWDAADANGRMITQYEITSTPATTTQFSFSTSKTFTGLTNGTSYTFSIRASNGVYGTSVTSGSIIPATTPGAPTSLTVDDNKGTYLIISFTTPVSDGGTAITNYKYSLNNGSSFTAFSPVDTSSPVTISGLTQNTTYNIKLLAVNDVGDGTASDTLTVLMDRVPDVPTNFSGVASDGQVSLTWTASASDGGEPIELYRITRTPDGSYEDVSGNVTSLVYTGLTNGTPYSFTVKAQNSIGFSGTASAGPYQPYIYSNPQLYPRPLVEEKAIQLWWDPPAFPGPLVSAYEITCPSPSVSVTVGSNATTAYITGLSTNTEYTFTVNTKIASLSTVGTAIFTGVTTGNQPGNITDLSGVLNGYLGATITWTPTVDDGGSPIKHQVVYAYCFDQSGNAVPANDIKQSYWSYTTTAYVYPFQEGYVYNVQVQAVNDCGYSINPPQITFNTF
jgi:hypothetical protein